MKFITNLKKILYTKRYHKLFERGINKNKVSYFEPEIFEKLKEYQFAGCPLNILIGSIKLSNGKCYDRSMGLTFIFDDCILVNGNLSRYAKTRGEEDYFHSWVEKDSFVYDTTWGMKFDKKLYYKLMGVKINKSQTTSQMMQDEWYVEQKEAKLEDNLSFIDIMVPLVICVLEIELREYENDKNKSYILLTKSLIQHCKSLVDIPKVKQLRLEREKIFKSMKW